MSSWCSWHPPPSMLHWFRYLKLRLSAFIKTGSGLGAALAWRVWHQTPGTFPRVLRSSDTRLMGSDRVPERKMLTNKHVSKMLLALHWCYQRVWGEGWACGRWLNIQGWWWSSRCSQTSDNRKDIHYTTPSPCTEKSEMMDFNPVDLLISRALLHGSNEYIFYSA